MAAVIDLKRGQMRKPEVSFQRKREREIPKSQESKYIILAEGEM